jgi:hypothetical protein
MTLFALTLLSVGLCVGGWQLARHGGWSNVAQPSLRFVLLPFIGFGLQWVALRSAGGAWRVGLFALSHCLLLGFLVANWKYASLRVLAVGYLLNLLPILANSGYMPITPEALSQIHPGTSVEQWPSGLLRVGSKDVVLRAAEAPLWFLGDVFVLAPPFPLPTAFSLGDVAIVIGFGWAVHQFTAQRQAGHPPLKLFSRSLP